MDSINSYEGGRLGLIDGEQVEDEEVEKARLISSVLELQNTLDDLNQRVDAVKFENLKLKSENQVLGQYIGEFELIHREKCIDSEIISLQKISWLHRQYSQQLQIRNK